MANDSLQQLKKSSFIGNQSALSEINISELCDESVLQLLDEPFDINQANTSKLRTDNHYVGFDGSIGSTYIYPTNYPIRQYQFDISRVALFKNTLVVLPTGLGKTFIAAVVMYNIFRWYPTGKIIFMAPTRPLVAQQIDACYEIMGIPKEETVELTGKQNKKIRINAWSSKRVFFVTPQVVWSDLNDPEVNFPMAQVKLIVIDEAHKAKGKYAYTDVIKSIASRNRMFRILALSATPGRSIKDVIEVVENLLISHIEVRNENSIDVVPYTFKKNIKTVVVKLDANFKQIRDEFVALVEPYVQRLIEVNVTTGNVGNLSKGWLLMDKKRYIENSHIERHPQHSKISTDLNVCISMYHALELLERHGVRVFLNYFADNTDGTEKYFVMQDYNIRKFLDKLRAVAGPFAANDTALLNNTSVPEELHDIDCGHPKFKILQKSLIEHFERTPESRCIIFCEFRESVFLLQRLLLLSRPLVKPKAFVGQGSSKTGTVTQKEQIAIMTDFRSGVCNTLIATCVAEEGIDVGEVDLIICFDVSTKNPTRFVQRIGRTGRKRQGQVIMLVTEGKEQSTLKSILATKDDTNQKISKSSEIDRVLYRHSPRLIPPEFNPQCIETFIKIPKEVEPASKPSKTGATTRSKKKTTTSKVEPKKHNLRSMKDFFKPIEMDEEDGEVFEVPGTNNLNTLEAQDIGNLEDNLNVLNTSLRMNNDGDMQISEGLFVPKDTGNTMNTENTTNTGIRKQEKLNRLIERYRTIKLAKNGAISNPIERLKRILNSTVITDSLKLSCLKRDRNFVQILFNSSDENDQNARATIEKVFGGKRKVRQFLSKKEETWTDLPTIRQEVIFSIMTQITESKELKHVADQSVLSNRSFKDDANEQNESEVYATQAPYMYDSQLGLPVYIENESKYESQRVKLQSDSDNFVANSSTPIRMTKATSIIQKSPLQSPIKNSPLAKAFDRCRQRKNEREKSMLNISAAKPTTPIVSPVYVPQSEFNNEGNKDFMALLGIATVDDLFADNESEYEVINVNNCSPRTNNSHRSVSVITPQSNQAQPKMDNKLNINLIPNDISDLFADDSEINGTNLDHLDEIPATNIPITTHNNPSHRQNPTQYSVTQILALCDANDVADISSSNKENIQILTNTNLEATDTCDNEKISKTTANFVINSVSDFFADDSDPEGTDLPNEKMYGKSDETIPKSGSDCTEEYDFEEIVNSTRNKPTDIKDNVEASKHFTSSDSNAVSATSHGDAIRQHQSNDLFAITNSSISEKSISLRAKEKLEQKESDNIIGPLNSGSCLPNIPNMTKSSSLITTTSTSFISKANNSSNVKTSSPLPSGEARQNGKPQSAFQMNISGVPDSNTPKMLPPNSPSSSASHNGSAMNADLSPSMINRRPNLSRLRTYTPVTHHSPLSNSKESVSSTYLTCQPVSGQPSLGKVLQSFMDSDDDFETGGIQTKLSAFQYKPNVSNFFRNNTSIYEVNNEHNEKNGKLTEDDDGNDDGVTFNTCRTASSGINPPSKRRVRKTSRKNSKRKKCMFIDNEAGVSGDDSEDEDEDDDFCTQAPATQFIDEGDPNVDMQAKYLQSIRSPVKRAVFKIPQLHTRSPVAWSQIYSQQVIHDENVSSFIDDSFVVKSDDPGEDESEPEMSELDRAEMKLEQKRKLKRKLKNNQAQGIAKRRRRIIDMSNDTDSD